MRRLFLASAALLSAGALSLSAAQAQQAGINRQQIYDQAYENLGIPGGPEAEQAFACAYQANTGVSPELEELLVWKYLTDYPDTAGGTAAVRGTFASEEEGSIQVRGACP